VLEWNWFGKFSNEQNEQCHCLHQAKEEMNVGIQKEW
jgi:hypothetical protein